MIGELKGKSFSFEINGITRKVFIHNVAILPEGYVSYYAIDNPKNDDILIIDIGSRTVNYASFVEGKIEKSFTNKIGTYDFYSKVKELENSKGEDYVEEPMSIIRTSSFSVLSIHNSSHILQARLLRYV